MVVSLDGSNRVKKSYHEASFLRFSDYDGLKNGLKDLPSCLNKAILPTIGPSIPHPNPIRKRPTKIIIRLAPNAIVIEPVIENNIAVMIGNFTDFNLSHKCLKI